ncbi:glucose dehydrogenase [FAD, quinone]-like, partial [Diaphorina citri]|uniref:Glucose dehydrogenase [FAD, quinone]-like n=1 Tax=Diaphorina citri TaxID=121845 RepID=A0A1S4EGS6_DIACI
MLLLSGHHKLRFTSGCVVTNRLTENPDWKVLLLEAGDEENALTDIPETAHYLQFTKFNWNFTTEFQPGACRGLNNERCPWPAGRAVGGASVINNNIYTRGNPNDFDRWLEAGNVGWGYKDVLPYFKKSEDIDVPELKRSEYHGVGGYLNVDYSPYKSKLMDAFLESAPEVGLNLTDYNSPDGNVGFSRIQGTIQFGRRFSASQAFLRPIVERPNFHVMKKARVLKVLIDPNTKRVFGVEFMKNNKKRVVYAKKEVVLSAGAFFSPHLLLLSGIGPREQLEQFNIPVLADLQVGENLQEHPAFASLAFTVNQKVGLVSDRIFSNLAKETIKAFTNQGWTTTLGCEGLGYVRTKYNNYPPGVPDIEYIFVPASLAIEEEKGGSLLRKTMGIPDRTFKELFRDVKNKDAWSIWPMLMYPESRGYVRLKSADPMVYPAVQSNFFQDPLDLLRIVEGIKMVIELSKTNAFQKYKSKLSTRILPACKKHKYGSDDYWGCCVRQLTMQMHHQCGTCKMGPDGDRTAVVDPRLRVHGIKGENVVDVGNQSGRTYVWDLDVTVVLQCDRVVFQVGNQSGRTYVWDLDVQDPSSIKFQILSHPRCMSAVRQTTLSKNGNVLLCVCDDGTVWRFPSSSRSCHILAACQQSDKPPYPRMAMSCCVYVMMALCGDGI